LQEIFLKYLEINMEDIKNQFNGFIEEKLNGKCKVMLNDEIDRIENDNSTNILKEFIHSQKDNDKILLSFICFKEEIAEDFFIDIVDKELFFANCIFEQKVYFTNLEFKNKVNFEGAEFKKLTNFNRVIFNNKCSFENVKFEKEVEFKGTQFKSDVMFSSSKFENFSSFEDAIFSEKIDFENTIAKDLFYFHNVKLGQINLIGSYLDKANFLRLKNNNESSRVLTKDNFSNKDSARIIKTHFEKENNITEANIYFVLEQEFFLDLLSKKNSAYPNQRIDKVSLLFNKYVSNFGTDWVRVLIIILVFGFLASLGYAFFEQTCTYFSSHKSWFIGGLVFSFILYMFYLLKHIKLFLFTLSIYILLFIFLPSIRELTNNIATLINPLNVFKPNKEYFKDIVIYGVFIKGVVATLIYQFIISFRNTTRRK